ncbi:hypothetical protein BST39_27010 [Mycobacterium paraseoulense]|uniref:Uncharacterized protein n=1 Tax=Mycobacterium paraseoulense TaxID=590652 RepID=A0A1X0I2R3_9MYCO|nr:hypothetical protein BST39_27010 [Mycobacterium paraseoulense]
MITTPSSAPTARLGGIPHPTARLGGNPSSLYAVICKGPFYPKTRWTRPPQAGGAPSAPALPGLAVATSGNLDFSSCVNIGEGPGRHGR